MLISIIIATYNAENTIEICLNSIFPQLSDQTELIVIDGGSKDKTNEIIASYIKYISYHISEKDEGVYDAWNKGIAVAKGQWILFMGADDKLNEGAIKCYLDFIGNNPNLDFISARINYTDKKGRTIAITGRQWNYERCRINMDVTHVASLTNKAYFKRIGVFNTTYKIVGDYELLMRGGSSIKAGFLECIVATMASGGISFSVKGLKEQMRVKIELAHMPKAYCYFIYIYQLFVFYTYQLRHR